MAHLEKKLRDFIKDVRHVNEALRGRTPNALDELPNLNAMRCWLDEHDKALQRDPKLRALVEEAQDECDRYISLIGYAGGAGGLGRTASAR